MTSQVDGQMDVYDVLEDIQRHGLKPVLGDFADIQHISARPLWNRISSPATDLPIPPVHSRTRTGGHRANQGNDHGDGGTAGSTSDR